MIGTLRRDCLDRVLVLDRHHLESVLVEFIDHYNSYRPHRCLTQHSPHPWDSDPVPGIDLQLAYLRRADRLGELIHEYRMVA